MQGFREGTRSSRTRQLSVATIAVALVAVANAACGNEDQGGGGGGGGSGSSSSRALEEGCLRLCDELGRCAGESIPDGDCLDACLPELEPYGEAGAALIDGCADCVEEHGCAALDDGGACAASCGGTAGLVGGGGPGGSGGGSSSGASCEESFVIPGGDGVVRCECSIPHDCSCDCFTAGVQSDWFASNDFCDVDRAARADRAIRGCDWPELR